MQTEQDRLFIRGTVTKEEELRTKVYEDIKMIRTIMQSSLGPSSLDKMIIDSIGETTVTNDGATILNLIDLSSKINNIVKDIAIRQDRKVGDGTTTVVLLACRLIEEGVRCVRANVHPKTIISGYRMALCEACKYIVNECSMKDLDDSVLANCARTCLNSKSVDVELFSRIAVDAIRKTKSVKSVFVSKFIGGSVKDSQLVDGVVVSESLASQLMPQSIRSAKIAFLDVPFVRTKLRIGIEVVVNDAERLDSLNKKEQDVVLDRLRAVVKSGANVVFTSQGIDEYSCRLLSDLGVIGVRHVNKEELKRCAEACGTVVVSTLADLECGESFDASLLGTAQSVERISYGTQERIVIRGVKGVTALLRGTNDVQLDEMERALHDALCVVEQLTRSNSVVCGGGCVECSTSLFLSDFANVVGSKEQMAVAAFADALLFVPETLVRNAGKESCEVVGRLKAAHVKARALPRGSAARNTGVGPNGTLVDVLELGVIEPTISKLTALRSAVEAAVSVLRIVEVIDVLPEEKKEEEGCGDHCE